MAYMTSLMQGLASSINHNTTLNSILYKNHHYSQTTKNTLPSFRHICYFFYKEKKNLLPPPTLFPVCKLAAAPNMANQPTSITRFSEDHTPHCTKSPSARKHTELPCQLSLIKCPHTQLYQAAF